MKVTEGEVKYGSDRARAELLEPEHDEHVWIVTTVHRTSAETLRLSQTIGADLDAENLAMVAAGCFVCEEPFSERLSYRKCPGDPTLKRTRG